MRHHPIRVGAPRDIVPPPSHDAATPPALLQRSDDDFVESTIEDLRTTAGRASLQDQTRRGAEHGTRPQAVPAAAAAVSPRRDRSVVRYRGDAAHRSGQGRFRRPRAAQNPRDRVGPVPRSLGQEQRPAARMGARGPAHRTGAAAGDTPAGATPGQPVDRSRAHPLRARARGCAARRARRPALHGAARRLCRSEEDALLRAGADSERRDRRRPRGSGPGARHRFRSRVGRLHGAPGRPAPRPADDVRARRRNHPPGLVRGSGDAGRGQAAGPAR